MNTSSLQQAPHTNHLSQEKSPYLQQHMHNPVDWYPWGDTAFQKAATENKPIFLSIGYSTCHWCHVMAHESFEDEEIAAHLNKYFISIKVDREERPDIDQIYMSFCQATTGRGGWPLTVFLTAAREPFYAGTYYPKTAKYGSIGLDQLLLSIHQKWLANQAEILASASEMTRMLNAENNELQPGTMHATPYSAAYDYFVQSFDSTYGGFGIAPKFPTPHQLLFLLRYYKAFNEPHALAMAERTLVQLYRGGIFDHIGFGFSRYATDQRWLIPHFEKMLYDNALLLMAYTEAYQVTGNDLYKTISEKIIRYVTRDLCSPEGAFYSAEDADSEGVEGKFYLWTSAEIIEVLGEADAKFFHQYYPVTEKGNFEGKTIINLLTTPLKEVHQNGVISERLEKLLNSLFKHREKRIHPHKDDKILVSWNGLMIAALAQAGSAFANDSYLAHAKEALSFIEDKMLRGDGRLFARYRLGERKHLGYLEDYAYLTWGYLSLYDATLDTTFLAKGSRLFVNLQELFSDKAGEGFYLYGHDAEQLIARPKELYDGALPSGNSVAFFMMLRLAKLTGNEKLIEQAEQTLAYFSSSVQRAPMSYTMLLAASFLLEQPVQEIVLAGSPDDPALQKMRALINKKYLPFTLVLLNDGTNKLAELNSFASTQVALDQQATAYVCENFVCQRPVTSLAELEDLLAE